MIILYTLGVRFIAARHFHGPRVDGQAEIGLRDFVQLTSLMLQVPGRCAMLRIS